MVENHQFWANLAQILSQKAAARAALLALPPEAYPTV
jgi:hypothetical protein